MIERVGKAKGTPFTIICEKSGDRISRSDTWWVNYVFINVVKLYAFKTCQESFYETSTGQINYEKKKLKANFETPD